MINDLLKDKLQMIVNDDLLIQAIKAIFDETVKTEMPQDIIDNALLGEKYRAYLIAKRIIEKSFIDLMSYKIIKPALKTFNKEK